MIWPGETREQWEERTAEWHRSFCWLPRQLADGRWAWVEKVWSRRVPTNLNSGYFWVFTLSDKPQPIKKPYFSDRPKPSAH